MVPANADALGLRPFIADIVDELDLVPFFQLVETGAGDIVAVKITFIAIQSFNEAQDVLQTIASTVNTYVTKTLEKGRVPAAEELSSGGCGEGCGCHH